MLKEHNVSLYESFKAKDELLHRFYSMLDVSPVGTGVIMLSYYEMTR